MILSNFLFHHQVIEKEGKKTKNVITDLLLSLLVKNFF